MKSNRNILKWYAIYTNPRAEKKVEERLISKGIETYLPLQKLLKKWSDRKKWIEEPLIRSYIFVRISEIDYFKVLNTPAVVRFITFSGKAVSIPEYQIDNLKCLLASDINLEVVNDDLKSGDPIIVSAGPLKGLRGELIENKGQIRVKVRLDHLGQSILATIPCAFLKPYSMTYSNAKMAMA